MNPATPHGRVARTGVQSSLAAAIATIVLRLAHVDDPELAAALTLVLTVVLSTVQNALGR